jgi:outer membrane biogenesis lipoprotein LolB
MNLLVSRRSRRRLRLAVPGLALFFVAACASTPPVPTSNLQAAQQAIANAERVDAATHAASELGEARGKLSSAQRAVEEEDMVMAGQFADEARAEAELAAARAGAAKANAVNDDMKQSTSTLIEEMQRKTGDSR